MKNNQLTMLFFASLFSFCGAETYAQKATVQIFPEVKQQIIRSIGGNYCQANYSEHASDAIGDETLREFKPTHVRVALPMRIRKTPFQNYRGTKYTSQPLVIEVLDKLKRMKNEFGVKNFTISVWDVPDEFIADPSKKAQRIIKPEAYGEVIT